MPTAWGRVVRASRILTPSHKLLWDEYRMLDQGDGAWITARSLSGRLGIPDRSIERLRDELRHWGLLGIEGRPPKVRVLVRLPDECVPPSGARPSDQEVQGKAALLDGILGDNGTRL